MPDEPQASHPFAIAMQWVSRITTVALEMVLPGLAGLWLDGRWGTSPLLGLVGFGLGMTLGIYHLVQMTRPVNKGGPHDPPAKDLPS